MACFGLFVVSHVLAGSGYATTFSGILPGLGLFNVDEALQFQDSPLTAGYFMLCLGHATLYAAGSLLVGLGLFQTQDIP